MAFAAAVVVAAALGGGAAGRLGRGIPDVAAAGGWFRYARPLALLSLLGALGLGALLAAYLLSLVPGIGFEAVHNEGVRLVCRSVVATLAANVAVVAGALGMGMDLALKRPALRDVAGAALVAGVAFAGSLGWAFLLAQVGMSPAQQSYTFLAGGDEPVAAALVGAFVVVGAPLTEELVWRGLVLGGALRVLSPRVAIVAVGTAFGLAHAADPLAVPPIVVLGLGLCALRAGSGSTWPGVLAHALYNAAGLLLIRSGA